MTSIETIPDPSLQRQRGAVASHFESAHGQWRDYYTSGAGGDVFKTRLELAMNLCRRHCVPGGRALDLGCGAGPASIALASMGHRVTGVDLSASMVDTAQAAAAESGLEDKCQFLSGDFFELNVPSRSFDTVVALGFIEYFDEPLMVLDRIRNLLSSTGIAIVQITNRIALKHLLRGTTGRHVEHTWSGLEARQYTISEFTRLARSAGFRRIDYRGHSFGPLKVAGRFIPGYRSAAWVEGRLDQAASSHWARGLGRLGASIVNVLAIDR